MMHKGQTNSGSFKKGFIPYSKGRKLPERSGINHPAWKGGDALGRCKVCSSPFYHRRCRTNAKYCSRLCAAIGFRGTPAWNKGLGTKSTKNELERKSSQYIKWRKNVFERDDYTCKACRKRGGHLNADHIKPFAHYPELRYELSNGRTLCEPCHRKTPTYGWSLYHKRLCE